MRLCADVHRHSERSARAVRRLHVDDVAGPEDAACAAAEADELRSLLATLPERQRDVLVDRASGMSVSQISSRHALTYKATESALSRARSTMRLALAAGLSFLGAVVATVRRRPSVVVAAPLTALAFVTTVAHTPYTQPTQPREVALDPPSAMTRGTGSVAARPQPVAPAATGAASRGLDAAGDVPGDGTPHPHRTQDVLNVDLGDTHGGAYKDERHSIVFYPDECLRYGWIVELRADPPQGGGNPHVGFDEYCGQPQG